MKQIFEAADATENRKDFENWFYLASWHFLIES